MNLKVVGSGSKGNSYLLETPTGTLILDAGMKYKDIQKALNFDFTKVVACLVTHEHGDHSRSVKDILKAGMDVFMSDGTAKALGAKHHRLFTVHDGVGGQLTIGDFVVLPFSTEHDASEPLGYLIYYKPTGEKLIFCTDSYYIRNRFSGLDYIMIECNYCKDTLDANIENGYIAQGMKNRLLESHFSLEHVKEFLSANDLSKVKKIVLLHLSYSNADSERMIREITELTGREVVIAESGRNIQLDQYPF
jgi:phosphoribosyl 1,2-cyclic phosphodiesterase